MAAAYLIEALRQSRESSGQPTRPELVLIGEESQPCYNRILLSAALAGDLSSEDLDMLGDTSDLSIVSGRRVTEIDSAGRSITLDDGQSLNYSKLVLAIGASAAFPRMDLEATDGAYCFRNLADLESLQLESSRSSNALVVGAGLLGLEAAWGLHRLGVNVKVMHRQGHILNRQLNSPAGRVLQQRLEDEGIEFALDCEVDRVITDSGRVNSVLSSTGETLPCDLLVFATGIQPNTALARNSGLKVDRGVLVNEWLETSSAHIFALGECAQVGPATFGLVAPIREQARVLARRLTGCPTQPFSIGDYPTQLKISGVEVFSAGVIDEDAEHITLESRAHRIYRQLFVRKNRLVGAVLVGNRRGANDLAAIIQEGKDISHRRHQLMFGHEPIPAPTNISTVISPQHREHGYV